MGILIEGEWHKGDQHKTEEHGGRFVRIDSTFRSLTRLVPETTENGWYFPAASAITGASSINTMASAS